MTQKERLVDLLLDFTTLGSPIYRTGDEVESVMVEEIADHLLSNGVIVPPCKVGEILYKIDRSFFDGDLEIIPFTVAQINLCHLASESIIEMRIIDKHESFIWVQEEDIPRYFFTTREEAEQALKERKA